MSLLVPDDVASLMGPEEPAEGVDAFQIVRDFAAHRPDAWKAVVCIQKLGGEVHAIAYLVSLGYPEATQLASIWEWFIEQCKKTKEEKREVPKSINLFGGSYVENQNFRQDRYGKESG